MATRMTPLYSRSGKRERHRPRQSMRPRDEHLDDTPQRSVLTHASCGPETCRPPATTADSMALAAITMETKSLNVECTPPGALRPWSSNISSKKPCVLPEKMAHRERGRIVPIEDLRPNVSALTEDASGANV